MRIPILFAIALSIYCSRVRAQDSGKITGSIQNIIEKKSELSGATITLLKAKDSATVKYAIAAKDGSFIFEKIENGKYLVGVTATGYMKGYSENFEITSSNRFIQLPAVLLSAAPKTMSAVTITAKRPLIE
ncbi:MAG TPA: carboxypeptidase-like regulatory domain-containing protein, partial [Flavitalea sp.]|nr:carboxypeptidase-like regulatory domain-containing protein [Flavitalea sp.]